MLKSGGPVMTVSYLLDENSMQPGYLECTWFDDDGKKRELKRATFHPRTLEKANV